MEGHDSGDKLTPEDEERILALMDDGVQASIATMFMGREHNDVITVDHIAEIMGELEVAWDAETLNHMVPEDSRQSLTLHDTKVIIGRFVDMAQRVSAEQAKADNAVAVSQSAATVVYLNTCAYLAQQLPCTSSEEGVTYRWNRPQIDIRPKTALMVSVAVMMLIATVTLAVSVAALANDLVSDQVDSSSRQFFAATDATFRRLTDVGARSVLADALQRTADSYAGIVDGLLQTHEALVFDGLRSAFSRILTTVSEALESAATVEGAALEARLSTIASIFDRSGTQDSLVALLRTWEERDGLLSAAAALSGPPVLVHASSELTRNCSGTELVSSACFDRANTGAGVPSSMEMSVCGQRFVGARVYVARLDRSVCLLRELRAVQLAVVDEASRLVTFTNRGLNDSGTYELQAAVQFSNDGSIQPIGVRRRVAAPCARVGSCADIVDGPYIRALQATNASQVYTGKMFGYEANEWMAAYARLNLIGGAQLALLYTVDHDPVFEEFKEAIGQGHINGARNTSVDPHIVLAVFDRLQRVTLLPPSANALPSAAERRYLTYALNRRRGFVVPTTTGTDDFLAGYTFAPISGIGVGVQISNLGLGEATTRYFAEVAAAANAELPEGWEITVYRVDDRSGDLVRLTAARNGVCDITACGPHPAANEALASQTSGSMETENYAREPVIARYAYDAGPPATVVVAELSRRRWVDEPQRRQQIEAAIVGLVVLAVAQLVIFVLTRRIMDRIELDYTRYKLRIEEEKAQFSDLVKDVMPPYIAERIMKGTRLIAETHSQLTFFFSDIVGSTETSKTMTNKQLVRMLGYTFMLEDEVAAYHGVHKIKTIGDAYFAVSGLEDSTSGAGTGKNHQVYRMVSFACVTQQLIGSGYTHYPERTECFRVSAGGQDLGPMRMVRMRMGIHTGSAVAGVVDVGRAPHFDCFGPSVNLASRMESTATAGRVQVSGPTAEVLSKLDQDGLFEFDAPRRTLVKGYGTMTTYLVRSTNINIPKHLLEKLGIEHANRREFFDGETAARVEGPTALVPAEQPRAGRATGETHSPEDGTGSRANSTTPPMSPLHDTRGGVPESAPKERKKEKKEKKEKHAKKDKKDRHSDKKEVRSHGTGSSDEPSPAAAMAVQPPMRAPVHHHQPQADPSATLLPDTISPVSSSVAPPEPVVDDVAPVPPGVPEFDVGGFPEPPPAFDPEAFDMPPPPPSEL